MELEIAWSGARSHGTPWASAQRNSTMNATRGSCATLHEIRGRVHLWSMWSIAQWRLLPHWLDHYARLGVVPAQTRILLDTHDGALGETSVEDALLRMRRVLETAGVNVTSVNSTALDGFNRVKMRSLNAFMAELPIDAYIVYADADELFSYPCGFLGRLGKSRPALCSKMMDRLPAGRVLPSVSGNAAEDIYALFPRCARMRKRAMGAFTVKITLLPVAVDGYRLRYATAHHAKLWNHNRSVYTKEYGSLSFAGCIDTGYFSHLSYTRDAVSFGHLKRNLPHRNKREKAYYDSMFALFEPVASADGPPTFASIDTLRRRIATMRRQIGGPQNVLNCTACAPRQDHDWSCCRLGMRCEDVAWFEPLHSEYHSRLFGSCR